MSSSNQKKLADLVSSQAIAEIDQWVAKFPADQKQSAVLQALRIVQDEQKWLSNEVMEAVAHYLEMPAVAVFEVASFYSMYNLAPVGEHEIKVCNSLSCMLNGSEKIIEHLKQRFGVEVGGTSADGKYTLKTVECLGACVGAPACQIKRDYHENMTVEKMDAMLEKM